MSGNRFDSAAMALRGRIGAYALHAKRDPRETTAKAREAFLAKFENQVDPDGVLDPNERSRRAAAARRAHFARLQYRSAIARRRRASKKTAPVADTPGTAQASEVRDASAEPTN